MPKKKGSQPNAKQPSVYEQIIELVFETRWTDGTDRVPFTRDDIEDAPAAIGIARPKNLGDVIYSYRFRRPLPDSINAKAPEGKEWIIRGEGDARYVFVATSHARVRPNRSLLATKLPDGTPEIVRATALGDEQALLALVRYNRLIDIFLGVAASSLQNHLRTKVKDIGQAEVDEVYVAVDRFGQQYILPVQAKGGTDEIGVVQTEQDVAVCAAKWPKLTCRPIAAQFMADDLVALFELVVLEDGVHTLREAHYRLVPHGEITDDDRETYRLAASGGAG